MELVKIQFKLTFIYSYRKGMNMASKTKKVLVVSEWIRANLKTSERWKDPATGVRGSAFYIGDNGLSRTFDTTDGNVGTIITKPKPGEQEPPTLMVQVPNGLSQLDTIPKIMMMHKETLLLMTLEDFHKVKARQEETLEDGVGAMA